MINWALVVECCVSKWCNTRQTNINWHTYLESFPVCTHWTMCHTSESDRQADAGWELPLLLTLSAESADCFQLNGTSHDHRSRSDVHHSCYYTDASPSNTCMRKVHWMRIPSQGKWMYRWPFTHFTPFTHTSCVHTCMLLAIVESANFVPNISNNAMLVEQMWICSSDVNVLLYSNCYIYCRGSHVHRHAITT